MSKLIELLYKIPGLSNLQTKRELCRELANYYSQSVKKSETEIRQLKDELAKKYGMPMNSGEISSTCFIPMPLDSFRLALLEQYKIDDKFTALFYNFNARFPILPIFIKQSTLERELGYSYQSFSTDRTDSLH